MYDAVIVGAGPAGTSAALYAHKLGLKCILLDKNTDFNAKPELEIYADDVKCSHGSTSGSLNENSIFYLRSRGLNYKQAKKLLISGFFLDVIEKITDEEIKNFIKKNMELNQ